MEKKGQVTLFILIAIILVGNVVLITLLRGNQDTDIEVHECVIDEDCLEESCSFANYCIPKDLAPSPDECAQIEAGVPESELESEPADYIQGRACKCTNNKCEYELQS